MSTTANHLDLQLNLHRLTQSYTGRRQASYREAGTIRRERISGQVPSLLQQLRSVLGEAVSSGGNSAGFEPKVPMNVPAFTLYQEIERTVRSRYQELTLGWRPHQSIEANLEIWAALAQAGRTTTDDGDEVADFAHITSEWIRRIETMFDPPRITELRAACPACSAEHTEETRDGERIRSRALAAVGDTVTCRACEATWTGREIHGLKAALDAAKNTPKTSPDQCHMA